MLLWLNIVPTLTLFERSYGVKPKPSGAEKHAKMSNIDLSQFPERVSHPGGKIEPGGPCWI